MCKGEPPSCGCRRIESVEKSRLKPSKAPSCIEHHLDHPLSACGYTHSSPAFRLSRSKTAPGCVPIEKYCNDSVYNGGVRRWSGPPRWLWTASPSKRLHVHTAGIIMSGLPGLSPDTATASTSRGQDVPVGVLNCHANLRNSSVLGNATIREALQTAQVVGQHHMTHWSSHYTHWSSH